ncbi:Glypican-5 Secreted glypican-5 [Collichthys lucidus]|uniref:Glypican-5 Secreted glypican-5 n=1 Tax=Collichthys lucidus TaxID=240159 RepID=A0A4U5U7K9_COLLU|nr:Glypican-5 Secreted glypican-5 [Collichthys lucidus]
MLQRGVEARLYHRYTLRVVGNGIKAQSINPEVKVKGADPVINQIIDKLKHINQDDEIRTVYGSTFSSVASITASVAVSGLLLCSSSSSGCSSSSFTCLLLWFPKWQAEGQVISLDLVLAPPA